MTEKRFSPEFLNAFVDDQLSSEDKSGAYPTINQDEELSRCVCELRKVRDLVRLGYRDLPEPRRAKRELRRAPLLRPMVASALLALGMLLGWAFHGSGLQSRLQSLSAITPQEPAPHAQDFSLASRQEPIHDLDALGKPASMKVLFHVNTGDAVRMREVLDEAEGMLRDAARSGKTLRVTVITNGEGLNLLRADTSPFAARIRTMSEKYSNLLFAACQNTIDRLKREQGIQAKLLPEAIVTDSGVAQIMLLQQRGWAYIRV